MQRSFRRSAAALIVALASAQQARAQVFVNAPGNIPAGAPFNNSETEQVDFADIDLDGDLDALFVDGGDCCNDQNRVWVNLGGVQGGTVGFFADETATRAPTINDTSRDVELVDFDADGDADALMVNTSTLSSQSGRWWTNQGGLQGGSAGFFADQTALRWVGLGAAGSSVAPQFVLAAGGFIGYGHDQDFADLDADGDLDLIAGVVGQAYGGLEPTRVFLNDGLGFFSEFNPSGFQLPSFNLSNGSPALWAEGLHEHDTNNVGGAFADVAVIAQEVALGDVDGDLDLDVLLMDRSKEPRLFENRLTETGVLALRDVTGTTWPQGWGASAGKYEVELGDLDGDLDLDLFGLDWDAPFEDATLRGVGNGTFVEPTVLPGTTADDDALEFLDHDSDGDLDVYIAAFFGAEKLFENVYAGGPLALAAVNAPVSGLPGTLAWDVETADLDQDGDADLMRAADGPNALLLNVLDVPDTTAPAVTALEQPADHASGASTRLRAHVYDNAPELGTARNATELHYSLDGGPFASAPMAWSGGQVFRGELPASAVGNVRYFARSTDEHGNVGESALKAIDTAGGCSGQPATYCTPKLNSDGCLPRMSFEGAPKVGGPTSFLIRGTDVLANANGLLIYSKAGPNSAPFNGGVLCVGAGLLRTPGQNSGGAGACGGTLTFDFNAHAGLGGDPGLVPGQKIWAQYWYRDVVSPGGNGLTDGVTFTLCP